MVLRLYLRESIWGEMGGPETVLEGESIWGEMGGPETVLEGEYMGRDGWS